MRVEDDAKRVTLSEVEDAQVFKLGTGIYLRLEDAEGDFVCCYNVETGDMQNFENFEEVLLYPDATLVLR